MDEQVWQIIEETEDLRFEKYQLGDGVIYRTVILDAEGNACSSSMVFVPRGMGFEPRGIGRQ